MTLEKLLNLLIWKGWKPRNREKTLHITCYASDLSVYLDWWFMAEDKKSFRELVSKESWLWQFVCKNRMIKWIWSEIEIKNLNEWYWVVRDTDYEYWIIQSALIDEENIEQFLLNNIKKW